MLSKADWSGLRKLITLKVAQQKKEMYYTNFEVGSISGSDGMDYPGTLRARTVDYIPIDSFVSVVIPAGSEYLYFAFLYNADKTSFTRIPSSWTTDALTKETLQTDYPEYYFVRFVFKSNPERHMGDDDLVNLNTLITIIG